MMGTDLTIARRLTLASLLSLCALAGVLALSPTPALAGPPEKPELKVEQIFASTAVFHGTLSPKGLVATNAAGEESALSSPAVAFTTLVAAPQITEANVSNVASTSATFAAQVNSEGAPTSYLFEYAPAGGMFTPVPEPEGAGSLPEGTTPVPVSVHVQHGLLPNTAYQFRVVATNSVESVKGEPVSFTTQTAVGSFALADGRQWELVSPPDKHGALIGSRAQQGVIQAAEDGSAITYGTDVPTEAEPPGYGQQASGFLGQVLSARGAQGWSTLDIATPHSAPTNTQEKWAEYLFFSPDLTFGLAQPFGDDRTLLSAQASEPTPYVRREGLCDAPATAAECYLPVLTGKEGYADVQPEAKFGEGSGAGRNAAFDGASPDLRHVVVSSRVALTKTPIEHIELYEWSAGVPASEAVQLVSMLPAGEGGGPTTADAYLGPSNVENTSARHQVSNDGSRVFWQATAAEGGAGGEALYVRDLARRETLRVDVKQPGAPKGGAPGALFQFASADGSRVLFSDRQRLTAQSGTAELGAESGAQESGDLYECHIIAEPGHLACELRDLTPESGGHSAEMQHIVSGAGEDASFAYFVANGVLGDAAAHGAEQGTCSVKVSFGSTDKCNLYEYHAGTTSFIATLSGEDEMDWGGVNPAFWSVGRLTARASADGRYLAFMSSRSLTGYDNRDAVSGKPDAEVYLYDGLAARLVCASCNPTGARPVGVEAREFEKESGKGPHIENVVAVPRVGSGAFGAGSWVAGNLPGNWIGSNPFSASLYQPRYLSDRGRLFFNSSDALVPQDVNRQEDVYEFEPAGVGSCSSSSATFVSSSGGCVSLVSSGTSGEESGFLDASAAGPGGEESEDVFFMTTSPLSSVDRDTSYDVYDAHVCSSAVPCVTPPAVPPPCSTEAACRAAPSAQPRVFGSPASASFTGAGNVPPGPVLTSKSPTRAQRLAKALGACRTKYKHSQKRRAGCEKQAKRAYSTTRKAVHGHRGSR